MGFVLLLIGVGLWIAAHFYKRFAPEARAKMGDKGKGVVAMGIVAGLVLMIIGYRMAAFIPVWTPPSFFTGINNLMMIGAIVLFGMSATTGRLRGKMRHPMLAAVMVWAVAHLMVNGDLASILLFGSMLIWAVLSVHLINGAETWNRPEPGEANNDIKLVIISVVVFVVIVGVHTLLGYSPFG
jgi:uncharacterized membrane protein